jgi:iron complex transport system ATP-binding protein
LLGLARRQVLVEGRTVVGVFQDINQAAAWCDHLIFMLDGRIAAQGPTRDVLNPDAIRAVFAVEAKVYHDDYANALQVVFKK